MEGEHDIGGRLRCSWHLRSRWRWPLVMDASYSPSSAVLAESYLIRQLLHGLAALFRRVGAHLFILLVGGNLSTVCTPERLHCGGGPSLALLPSRRSRPRPALLLVAMATKGNRPKEGVVAARRGD